MFYSIIVKVKEVIKTKANADVRNALKEANITIWRCALQLGVCESTLIRWLRTELPQEKREQIFKAIEDIKIIAATTIPIKK